jgi:N-acetylglucosaminyldiphosphoundecaprenol N-acetyl-beta-D-mannosaminyltransferase
MLQSRISLFGITIDNLTMVQAVERIGELLKEGRGQHYVATPNVDHIVRLYKDCAFRQAYASASLVLADGMPVIWASRLLRRPLQMRVTGADLLPAVCEMAASTGRSVFLLGGLAGVAERAAHNLRLRYAGLQIAGTYSPALGFERDAAERARIIERINAVRPDILAIGLGAPKQELWIAGNRSELHFGVALCIGAAIDFAAGELERAPRWMQEQGFEWLWRLSQQPRRLWRRYLVEDMAFARIVAREWWRIRVRGSPYEGA